MHFSISETLKKLSINQLIGTYEIQVGVNIQITLKNDSLHVLQTWDNSSYSIINTTGNNYIILNNPSIQFTFSELKNNFTQTLTVHHHGSISIGNRKDETNFSNLGLKEYAGEYYNQELEVSYLVFLEDDKLKVKIPNYDPLELKEYKQDEFTAAFCSLRFHNLNGEVQSFELEAGRVRNLKFEKN